MKKLLLIPSMLLLCFVSSCCGSCNSGCQNDCVRSKEDSSDWSITTKVKAAILAETSISAFARFVSVSTTDGVVTLTGKVPTREDAHKIVKIAKNVKGVKRVDNQMTISN